MAALDHNAEVGLNPLEQGLEAQGRRAEFVAFCDDTRRRLVGAGAKDPLAQWYLAPAPPSSLFTRVGFEDDFSAPVLRPEWQWEVPPPPPSAAGGPGTHEVGGRGSGNRSAATQGGGRTSTYSLSERPGFLTLRPAEGTDLTLGNISAPRLLLEVRGDFALEARMEGDWEAHEEDRSSGLLVWKDVLNFVRLEKFTMERKFGGSLRLETRARSEWRLAGRGLLRGDAFHLRLEREGERLTSLCRADGSEWLTCGQVDFTAPDPLRVGITSLMGMVAHFDWVRVLTKA